IDGDVLARGAVRQPLDESSVKRRVAVIAGHEIEAPREAPDDVAVHRALPRDQRLELRAEILRRPVAARERDETQALVEQSAAVEVVERRQELPRRKIAGRAEDDEAARSRHVRSASRCTE